MLFRSQLNMKYNTRFKNGDMDFMFNWALGVSQIVGLAMLLIALRQKRAPAVQQSDDGGCLLLPTDMHGGRCEGRAMVTAVIRGGSTSMRTAIMLNLHQPHGKGKYRFMLLPVTAYHSTGSVVNYRRG